MSQERSVRVTRTRDRLWHNVENPFQTPNIVWPHSTIDAVPLFQDPITTAHRITVICQQLLLHFAVSDIHQPYPSHFSRFCLKAGESGPCISLNCLMSLASPTGKAVETVKSFPMKDVVVISISGQCYGGHEATTCHLQERNGVHGKLDTTGFNNTL